MGRGGGGSIIGGNALSAVKSPGIRKELQTLESSSGALNLFFFFFLIVTGLRIILTWYSLGGRI